MTTRLDPIIAVKDVEASAAWYGDVFGFNNIHGDPHFAVLTTADNDIMLCLHDWGDEHPTMTNPNITAGNGMLLYFRTTNWQTIRRNLDRIGWPLEEDIHQNPNSRKQEFSFRDPDGYYLTVTEAHVYQG